MNILVLLLVSAGATFSVIWLITYAPLAAKRTKIIWFRNHKGKFCLLPKLIQVSYSPRLFLCRLLVPLDIGISLFLVFAGMLGISTAVTGISMMVFNVCTAIGFSAGVGITHKFLQPKWEQRYKQILQKSVN